MPPPPALPGGVIPPRMKFADYIHYGRPAATELPAVMRQLGRRRAFLMVSRSLRRNTGVVSGIERALGGACAGVYDGMPQHSPRDEVVACARKVRELGADVIVTVGGGSLTDAAKIAQVCIAHGVDTVEGMDAMMTEQGGGGRVAKGPHPALPVRYIAVPTTLSAGEFTNFAGITDPRRKRKQGFGHPDCAPQAVILDPAITVHTPMWLWLSTGMRSVDHCVEALCQLPRPKGFASAYGDGLATAGLSLLAPGLRRCKEAPNDLNARLNCQLGSFFAIQGIQSNGGGASHAIGHILGGTFNVPHGYTSCVALPSVLRWNEPASAGRQAAVAAILGRPGAAAADAVHDLVAGLGLPTTLAEVGVAGPEALDLAARETMLDRGVRTNPRKVAGPADILQILHLAAGSPKPKL